MADSSGKQPIRTLATGDVITEVANASGTTINPAEAQAQGSTTSGETGVLGMGAVTTAAPSYTTAQTQPLSLDTAGNLRVLVTGLPTDADSLAQGSTTAGQSGGLAMGAVTTSAPSYTTAQTNALSLKTNGELRVADAAAESTLNSILAALGGSSGSALAQYDLAAAVAGNGGTSTHTFTIANANGALLLSIVCSSTVGASYHVSVGGVPKWHAITSESSPTFEIDTRNYAVANGVAISVLKTNLSPKVGDAFDIHDTINIQYNP
jgi:hypothetical protein